jgi:hypothetical protein
MIFLIICLIYIIIILIFIIDCLLIILILICFYYEALRNFNQMNKILMGISLLYIVKVIKGYM